MRCIALDDEPMALDVVKEYIGKIPFLSLEATFRSPLKAIDFLNTQTIDLLFLDINMPDLTGIQLIKSINYKPMVILTTAYSKYAIESYELDVIDYLLKPIRFDRFLKAVNKAKKASQDSPPIDHPAQIQETDMDAYTFVRVGNDLVKLVFDDIKYIEGNGNYLIFHMTNSKIMTLMKMKDAMTLLPKSFIRIHKSFIISINQIDRIERHQVTTNNVNIPIGSIYREVFLDSISKG